MVLAESSATGRAELHSVNKPGHQSEFCHLTNVCLWVSSSVKLKITTVHRTLKKVINKRHCSCHFLFRTSALAILKGICKISGWTPWTVAHQSPLSWNSPGVRSGNLLQYSCLENCTERGTWRARILQWVAISFSRESS